MDYCPKRKTHVCCPIIVHDSLVLIIYARFVGPPDFGGEDEDIGFDALYQNARGGPGYK
jgi:hypothetical protein